jgi:hypothetical protein
MHSTAAKLQRTGETALLALGACLSVISFAVVLEMVTAPRSLRPTHEIPLDRMIKYLEPALDLSGVPRITGLAPPVTESPDRSIRSLDEDTYEIPRSWFEATGSGCQIPQARIVPVFRSGAAFGFKVLEIRPHSIYAQLGLVDGDVIRRINGFDMNSPLTVLEAYSRLRDADRFELDLERNCEPLRKTYLVR